MKTYKFTLMTKEYFDYEIEAESEEKAREMFLRGDWKEELNFAKPSETDTEDFMEEV